MRRFSAGDGAAERATRQASGVQGAPPGAPSSWAQCAGSPAKGRGMARTKAAGSAGNLALQQGSRAASVASDAHSKAETEEDPEVIDALLQSSDPVQRLVQLPSAGNELQAGSPDSDFGSDDESDEDEGGPRRLEVVGLNNPGYLCFLNAGVQALLGCAAFSTPLRGLRGERELLARARAPTLAAFAAFLGSMDEARGSAVTASAPVRTGRFVC
jgi:hypothetical protein